MRDVLIREEARQTPNIEIANDQKLRFLHEMQGSGMFASLADTLVGEIPTNMKGVALADAFVLADGDARGQINDDFNGGGRHGSVHKGEPSASSRTRQLHPTLCRRPLIAQPCTY